MTRFSQSKKRRKIWTRHFTWNWKKMPRWRRSEGQRDALRTKRGRPWKRSNEWTKPRKMSPPLTQDQDRDRMTNKKRKRNNNHCRWKNIKTKCVTEQNNTECFEDLNYFTMGVTGSRKIPPKMISSKLLTNPGMSKKDTHFPLTPRMCVAAIKTSSEPVSEKELNSLKSFLYRQSKVPVDNVCRSVRIVESEICRQLRDITRKSTSSHLSPEGRVFLAKTLRDTKSELGLFERQTLLRRRILPHLQRLVEESGNNLHPKGSFFSILRLWSPGELLHPKDMRKYPRTLIPDSELDRAHKLSLFLAVKLWQCVFGHNYINQNDRIRLKRALCHNANLIYTCKFTNRVMHVRYDNEIASALAGGTKGPILSSGATLRAMDVLNTIKIVRTSDSRKMTKYWEKSEKLLKNMIPWDSPFDDNKVIFLLLCYSKSSKLFVIKWLDKLIFFSLFYSAFLLKVHFIELEKWQNHLVNLVRLKTSKGYLIFACRPQVCLSSSQYIHANNS